MPFKSMHKPNAPFTVSRQTCLKRISDAKLIGWKALEQSWQRDLEELNGNRSTSASNAWP